MGDGFGLKLKRFILWDYPRGGLPYDIMCGLILAFIFLTPRDVFRDQPKPKEVVLLPDEGGRSVFWIEPALLAEYSDEERPARAEALLRDQAKAQRWKLVRLEPIFDSEEEIRGVMAFAER